MSKRLCTCRVNRAEAQARTGALGLHENEGGRHRKLLLLHLFEMQIRGAARRTRASLANRRKPLRGSCSLTAAPAAGCERSPPAAGKEHTKKENDIEKGSGYPRGKKNLIIVLRN